METITMDEMQTRLDDDACWRAVVERDGTAAGAFVVAVDTTGIYCRPGCPARTPRRANVRFFPTPGLAERAGYRACKRCRPNRTHAADPIERAVAEACRLLDANETGMTLVDLAAAVGVSRWHLQRAFKRRVGVSPRAYAAARRAERLRGALPAAGSVTAAIAGAGFGSVSRVYEDTNGLLGMPPATFRRGGRGETVRYAVATSTLGQLLVAATERGVCAIDLGDAPEPLVAGLRKRFPNARLDGGDPAFAGLVDRVVALVESPGVAPDLPLDVRGTAFQARVWNALRQIGPGETATYGDVAERIGAPTALRAVAQACGANPLLVAIPCHRVVAGGGGLGGYRSGAARKRALLDREGARTGA